MVLQLLHQCRDGCTLARAAGCRPNLWNPLRWLRAPWLGSCSCIAVVEPHECASVQAPRVLSCQSGVCADENKMLSGVFMSPSHCGACHCDKGGEAPGACGRWPQGCGVCVLAVCRLCIPTVQAARQGGCMCDEGTPCAVEELVVPLVQVRCGGGVIPGVSALAVLAWLHVPSLTCRGLRHVVCRRVLS